MTRSICVYAASRLLRTAALLKAWRSLRTIVVLQRQLDGRPITQTEGSRPVRIFWRRASVAQRVQLLSQAHRAPMLHVAAAQHRFQLPPSRGRVAGQFLQAPKHGDIIRVEARDPVIIGGLSTRTRVPRIPVDRLVGRQEERFSVHLADIPQRSIVKRIVPRISPGQLIDVPQGTERIVVVRQRIVGSVQTPIVTGRPRLPAPGAREVKQVPPHAALVRTIRGSLQHRALFLDDLMNPLLVQNIRGSRRTH